MIRAGQFRSRIDLQSKSVAYDSYNQPIETWSTAKTIWAEVITGGGGEFYAAQRLYAETSVVFRIRYDPNVTSINRVQWNGRTFEVLNVNDVGLGHVEMLLTAREVV